MKFYHNHRVHSFSALLHRRFGYLSCKLTPNVDPREHPRYLPQSTSWSPAKYILQLKTLHTKICTTFNNTEYSSVGIIVRINETYRLTGLGLDLRHVGFEAVDHVIGFNFGTHPFHLVVTMLEDLRVQFDVHRCFSLTPSHKVLTVCCQFLRLKYADYRHQSMNIIITWPNKKITICLNARAKTYKYRVFKIFAPPSRAKSRMASVKLTISTSNKFNLKWGRKKLAPKTF